MTYGGARTGEGGRATEGARSRAGSALGSHAMHDFLRDDARGARIERERERGREGERQKKDISGMAACHTSGISRPWADGGGGGAICRTGKFGNIILHRLQKRISEGWLVAFSKISRFRGNRAGYVGRDRFLS